MKPTQNISKSSFFNCCQDCLPEEAAWADHLQTLKQAPSAKKYKYGHQILTPKASLKDIKFARSHKTQKLNTPKCQQSQKEHIRSGKPSGHCVSRSDFNRGFVKEAKVMKNGSSLIFQSTPKTPQQPFSRTQNSQFFFLSPSYQRSDSRYAPPTQQFSSPQSYFEIQRFANLEKATQQTETSSKHALNSDPRFSRLSRPCTQSVFQTSIPTDVKLGFSRFTVLSECEDDETPHQVKLQESAVLVNVFNPTDSQYQNWTKGKSKILSSGKNSMLSNQRTFKNRQSLNG